MIIITEKRDFMSDALAQKYTFTFPFVVTLVP